MFGLQNVCLVVDCDGFFINKKFHVREFGYKSLTRPMTYSFLVDISPSITNMTSSDYRAATYCTFNVHGLSLKPKENEICLQEQELKKRISQIYNKHKTKKKFCVAYKGGHIEKDILEELKIPYINLEDYGCPKFNELIQIIHLPSLKDCGHHLNITNAHCPRKETAVFARWLIEKLK